MLSVLWAVRIDCRLYSYRQKFLPHISSCTSCALIVLPKRLTAWKLVLCTINTGMWSRATIPKWLYWIPTAFAIGGGRCFYNREPSADLSLFFSFRCFQVIGRLLEWRIRPNKYVKPSSWILSCFVSLSSKAHYIWAHPLMTSIFRSGSYIRPFLLALHAIYASR